KKPRSLAGASSFDAMENYIFPLQVLVEALHTPPALSQSAFVLILDRSVAKADVAKATPRVSAKAYAMVFMGFLPVRTQRPLRRSGGGQRRSSQIRGGDSLGCLQGRDPVMHVAHGQNHQSGYQQTPIL